MRTCAIPSAAASHLCNANACQCHPVASPPHSPSPLLLHSSNWNASLPHFLEVLAKALYKLLL